MTMPTVFQFGRHLVVCRGGSWHLYAPDGRYIRHFETPGRAVSFVIEKRLAEETRSRRGESRNEDFKSDSQISCK